MVGVLSWGSYWSVREANNFWNNQEISYILWNSEGSLLYSQKCNTCPCFEPDEFSPPIPILFLLLHLLCFCVRCNLCCWQFFSHIMVSLLQVYPPVCSLHISYPPCMPHAPHLYFSVMWASAQRILSSIVSALACWDYCLKWGSVLPLSKAWHDVHTCLHDAPPVTGNEFYLMLNGLHAQNLNHTAYFYIWSSCEWALPSLNGNFTAVWHLQCPVVAA